MNLSNQSSALPPEAKTAKLVSNTDSGTLRGQYHAEELKIHNRINNIAIGIIMAGFVLIFYSIHQMIITGNSDIGLIGGVAGIITEAISGVLFWFVTKASDDKWKYFGELSETDEEQRVVALINSSENSDFRDKMIEKLVDAYCENKKSKYVN